MKQILLFLVLGVAAAVGAQTADAIEAAVPADAILYVYLDVPAYLDGMNTYTSLLKTMEEGGAVRKFLEPVLTRLDKEFAQAEAEHKLDFKISESLPCLKTGYGLVMSGAYVKAENIPAVMLVLQTGANEAKIRHIVDVLVEQVAASEKKVTIDTLAVNGVDFHRLVFQPETADPVVPEWIEGDEARAKYVADARAEQDKAAARLKDNPLVIGVHKGYLAATNCPALAEAFFTNIGAKDAAGLAANAGYQAVMTKVHGSGAPVKAYVNTTALVEWLKKMPPDAFDAPSAEELQRVVGAIHTFGLSDLAAVGLALTFQADRLDESLFLAWPAGEQGVLKALLKDRGTPEVPAVIHPDTAAAGAYKGDLQAAYREVIKLITAIKPDFPEQFAQNQDQMRQSLGFDVDGLIASFNGNVAFYTCPPDKATVIDPETQKEIPAPNVFTIMLDMTEATVLPKLLETMLPQMGPFIAPEEFMGEKIYVVGIPTGGAQPAFALINNRVIISFGAEELRSQVRRAASDAHKLSDAVRDGIAQLKAMPPAGSFMSLYRARGKDSQLAKLYDAMMKQVVEEANSKFELELKAEDIPPFAELQGFLDIDTFIKGGEVEGGYLIMSQSFNRSPKEEAKPKN